MALGTPRLHNSNQSTSDPHVDTGWPSPMRFQCVGGGRSPSRSAGAWHFLRAEDDIIEAVRLGVLPMTLLAPTSSISCRSAGKGAGIAGGVSAACVLLASLLTSLLAASLPDSLLLCSSLCR